MSERIPPGWKSVRLKDFTKGRRGTTYNKSELSENSSLYPLYINMKSFRVGGGYSINGDKFYSSPYTKTQLVMTNDLLIANTDVTASCDILGAPVYLPEEKIENDVLFSHHVTALSLSEDVDKLFLFYLLCLDKNRVKMQSYGRGTTVKMLNTEEISNLLLTLPPLPEQKKIASILTSVDEVIENTQQQIEKLRDLKKATMNDLLTKGIGHTEFKDSELGRIPPGWKSVRLKDFTKGRRGTTYNKSELSENSSLYPLYINMKSFRVGGGYSINGDKFYSSPYTKTQLVMTNDLLIANTDVTASCDILGAPVYLPEEKIENDVLFSHHVTALSLSEDVDKLFLFYLLCLDKNRVKMQSYGRGTTVKMLNTEEISNLLLTLPPLPEQKKIASILSSIDKNIEEKQHKLNKTQSLKKALMQDFLTGKVRVKVN